jgi:hypothetical protein
MLNLLQFYLNHIVDIHQKNTLKLGLLLSIYT